MRRIIKIILILASLTIILSVFCNITLGAEFDPDPYISGLASSSASDVGRLQDIGNTIIGIIRTIGSITSVAIIIIIGIKYMSLSLEEKAQYKQTMIYYFIGAILIFGITNLLAIVINLAGLFG